jgi:hypothetical protein
MYSEMEVSPSFTGWVTCGTTPASGFEFAIDEL